MHNASFGSYVIVAHCIMHAYYSTRLMHYKLHMWVCTRFIDCTCIIMVCTDSKLHMWVPDSLTAHGIIMVCIDSKLHMWVPDSLTAYGIIMVLTTNCTCGYQIHCWYRGAGGLHFKCASAGGTTHVHVQFIMSQHAFDYSLTKL